MIHYFFIFYSFLFSHNITLCIFIISIILISSSLFIHHFRQRYFIITIKDMKIKNKFIAYITLFCILLIISSFFVYRRILNIGNFYDIKILLFKIYINLSNMTIISLFILGIFFWAFFIFIMQVLLLLQKFIFYQALKYHIYIIAYTSNTMEPFYKRTLYEKFIDNINPITYIPFKVEKFILYFLYYIYKFLKKGEYKESFENFWIMLFSQTSYCYYRKNITKYLIICSIFYDIIFNEMVINTIYFLLPFTFAYYLKEKFLSVVAFIEQSDCIRVYNILTKKIKVKANDIIIFEDNTHATAYDIQEFNAFNRKVLRAYIDENSYTFKDIKQVPNYLSFFVLTLFLIYTIINHNVIVILSLLDTVYNINMNILLFLIYDILIFNWIFSQRFKICNYVYWCFYALLGSLLFWLFCKHHIVFFFNDIFSHSFIKLVDAYTIKEKIYFFQEYLKYKLQSTPTLFDKEYLLYIFKDIPLHNIITSEITILQLSEFIDNLIILHEKHQEVLSFLLSKKNNEIIQDIETQQSLINNTMKSYIITFWENIKTKYIKIT